MISEPEWLSITKLAEKVAADVAGTRKDYFITGQVIKVDEINKCVFLKEFGDQPIPLVGFDYEVKYYDEGADGTIEVKKAKATIAMPKRGQSVLVAREYGVGRLPRCLGVIMGKNWIVPEEE